MMLSYLVQNALNNGMFPEKYVVFSFWTIAVFTGEHFKALCIDGLRPAKLVRLIKIL